MLAKQVDGIVVTSAPYAELGPEIERIRALGSVPILTADCPGIPGTGVDFDLEDAASQSTRHLLEHGHRRIGMLSPPVDLDVVKPIHRGYLKSLSDHGVAAEPEWIRIGPDFSQETGKRLARMILAQAHPPSAVLCGADMLAIGAMQVWKEEGLELPADLALASIGEVEFSRLTEPPLTTVRLPAYEMGREVMGILSKLIKGEKPRTARRILGGELVVRRGCGCS